MRGRFIIATAVAMFSGWSMASADDTPPALAQTCRLSRLASLSMRMDGTGRITVPIGINGVERRMMVDTGAANTMISKSVADELGLKTQTSTRSYMQGFGGRVNNQIVRISEMRIGKMTGKGYDLFVISDLDDSAGLLGGDFFSPYDLDLDFARARLNLVSPNHCPGQVVYWTKGEYSAIPFEIDGNLIVVEAQLDGKPVTTFFDTGAADTVMSLERASRVYDLDARELKKSRHYPFKSLTFGGVAIANPSIELEMDDESQFLTRRNYGLHMVVGMGVLRRLHLYISYREKKIYVTPATQY